MGLLMDTDNLGVMMPFHGCLGLSAGLYPDGAPRIKKLYYHIRTLVKHVSHCGIYKSWAWTDFRSVG